MNKDKEEFQFSYSAKEQEEIKRIRDKYRTKTISEKESKMEQLRRLDASVTKKSTIASIVLGIVSCLVMGAGMSMILVGSTGMFAIGIVVGVVGIVGTILAYPLYMVITGKERQRIAPDVLRLTEELLK